MRYYDVTDVAYGAVGDGVTDDTTAIQAAITAAAANGGGRIYFPKGIYAVTGIVVTTSNITLHGEFSGGWVFGPQNTDGSILKYIGAAGGKVIDMGQVDNTSGFVYGCGIYDISINGESLADHGIYLRSLQNSSFERIFISSVNHIGLMTVASDTVHVTWNYHNKFEHIFIAATGTCHGILIDGIQGKSVAGGRSTAFNNFYCCHVTHLNGFAYAITSGDDNCFYGCGSSRADGGTGYAVYLHGSNKTTGQYRAALGNHFFGFYGNSSIRGGNDLTTPLANRWPSRGNKLFITGVDAAMSVIRDNSEVKLYIEDVGGQTANGYAKTAPETLA